MEIQDIQVPAATSVMVRRPVTWNRDFTFRGKTLYYNRIPYNNRAERAVEIPLAFEFLIEQKDKGSILEIGNVLQHYENSLSDVFGIRTRRIVDKFEVGHGIDNLDIFDVDGEKYQTIVCISTAEHVGQNGAPTGDFGEQNRRRDLEAPVKAVAKIYDLLSIGGRALVTVPFGKLIDGGWYVQFSSDYLDLLVSRYNVPREALNVSFLKRAAREAGRSNPHQIWTEVKAEDLSDTRYDHSVYWCGARSIAVIELTKSAGAFQLELSVPPTPLNYENPQLTKKMFTLGGFLRKLLPFS